MTFMPSGKETIVQTRKSQSRHARGRRAHRSPYLLFSLLAVAVVLIIALLISGFQGASVWAWMIAINTATLLLYLYDKKIAGSGRTRVPEAILHGAELLGGTPVAFVAQRLLPHKIHKRSYQLVYWLIVAIQIIGLLVIWQLGWL